jgi:hypothetical protein
MNEPDSFVFDQQMLVWRCNVGSPAQDRFIIGRVNNRQLRVSCQYNWQETARVRWNVKHNEDGRRQVSR